jgi:hypothetical protein
LRLRLGKRVKKLVKKGHFKGGLILLMSDDVNKIILFQCLKRTFAKLFSMYAFSR